MNKKVDKLEDEYENLQKSYDSYRMNNLLIPTEFIIISLIRKTENDRQTDFCIGLSTNYGFITDTSCCQADAISIFSLKNADEISIEKSSIWTEENLCLLNTTEKIDFDLPVFDFNKTLKCSILAFDIDESQLRTIRLEIDPQKCVEGSCLSNINQNSFENVILLDGLSIFCPQSLDFGMIKKCKIFNQSFSHTLSFFDIIVKLSMLRKYWNTI